MRGFDRCEFEARCASTQQKMQTAGLDAVLLTTEADVRYYTGFLTRFWESPTRPWFVVLPASGAPIAIIPSIGRALMQTTWVTDIRCWSAPDPQDDGVGLLSETLREIVPEGGRIGIPDGHETHVRMPLADVTRLQTALGKRALVSDQDIVKRQRMIKSAAEIEKIKTACGVADRTFERVDEIASSGKPLDHVFRHFQMICLDEGADWVPYLAGAAGQSGYLDVISPATSEPLETGDILMLDTGLVCDGYFCDFDRNWSIGLPSEPVEFAYARLIEAVDAATELARPGATASTLFHAMNSIVTQTGDGTDAGRLGHGLGMTLTEAPSLIPQDHTVLEPGMVLTLEPSIVVEGTQNRILVHEENVVITKGAPEFLSTRQTGAIKCL